MSAIDQETAITNEEKEFIEFMRDDSATTYIVNGTLIKKLFMQNTDEKFLDIGSGLIPLKSDFSKQSDDKLVWILVYIKVLLVAEMQEEDEEEL
ncbi:hypothetical protein [Helicobacter equorum]|uniref:hypothetical protein n=1 Tax=Helicobacter equorum TaxID=361872 RepID=UPI000CF1A6F9|nr:hypothetical protein [Helicobacter equorum]